MIIHHRETAHTEAYCGAVFCRMGARLERWSERRRGECAVFCLLRLFLGVVARS